jgi:hypothetical protein
MKTSINTLDQEIIALSVADLHIGEKHIYGSSLLGILNANYSTDATTDGLGTYVSPWTSVDLPAYTGITST